MGSWAVRSNRDVALRSLGGRLIVSCQAAPGDPLDDVATLTRIARSVLRGGACGLRAEGAACVAAFREVTELPIIGIVKTIDARGDVYITPDFAGARAIAEAGADMVALDCTARRLVEAEPWTELILRIHEELGLPVLADVATIEDALAAERAGADAVASTLCGYTAETAGARAVAWPLIEAMVSVVRIPVVAEGHIQRPEEVSRALRAGAHAVVVGSAITRPEMITARFAAAARGEEAIR